MVQETDFQKAFKQKVAERKRQKEKEEVGKSSAEPKKEINQREALNEKEQVKKGSTNGSVKKQDKVVRKNNIKKLWVEIEKRINKIDVGLVILIIGLFVAYKPLFSKHPIHFVIVLGIFGISFYMWFLKSLKCKKIDTSALGIILVGGKVVWKNYKSGLIWTLEPLMEAESYDCTMIMFDLTPKKIITGLGNAEFGDIFETSLDVLNNLRFRYTNYDPKSTRRNIGYWDAIAAMESEIINISYEIISTQSFRKTVDTWPEIRRKMLTSLNTLIGEEGEGERWGFKINEITREDLRPVSQKVIDSLDEVAETEIEKKNKIIRAEGEAESAVAFAKGQAKAMSAIAETLRKEGPAAAYKALEEYFSTIKQSGAKYLVPLDPTELLKKFTSIFAEQAKN